MDGSKFDGEDPNGQITEKASFFDDDRCSMVSSWISNEMAKEPSLIQNNKFEEITSMTQRRSANFLFQIRTNSKGFTPKELSKELERSPF